MTGLVKCGKSGSNGKKEVRNENYTVNGVEVPKEFSRSEKRQLKDADSLLKAEDEDNTDEAASNEITEDGINKNTIGYMHVYEIIKSDGTITGAF